MHVNRILFVVLGSLVAARCADAVEPKGPGQFKTLTELRDYTEQKIDTAKSQGGVSPELLAIADRLREPSSTVAECDQLVVGFVRKQYARDIHVSENTEIHDADGQVIDGLPFLVFLYKGSMTGAYEYTRLCRGSIDAFSQAAHLFSEDKRNQILLYRLFVIVGNLNDANTDNYVFQRRKTTIPLEKMLGLKKEYPRNEVLRNFLLGYPFDGNSYLNILGRLAAQKMYQRSREELFFEYLTKLFVTPEERLAFLREVAQRDSTLHAGLLTRVVQQDPMLKDNASYLAGVFDLAMQSKNWQAAGHMLSNPLLGDRAAELKKQTLDETERLRKEEAMLSALSEEVGGASSQTKKPSGATDK